MLNVSLIFYLPENEFLMHVHLIIVEFKECDVAKEKYIRQFFFFRLKYSATNFKKFAEFTNIYNVFTTFSQFLRNCFRFFCYLHCAVKNKMN